MAVAQDIEALLWVNGCDLETAKFVSRMLAQNGYALVKSEYLESIGTPFASIHTHDEACERLRRINSSTYSGMPSKQVLSERTSSAHIERHQPTSAENETGSKG